MDRSRSHTLSKKEKTSIAQQPSRRQQSRQFKIDAIELSLNGDKSIREIANNPERERAKAIAN
ncbi:hypothetical protein EST62_01690 [Chlorobaculum sp. 24CR]|nr:hypothetical protein EST62_01690 [Chlorobaculum sp. 24CR]